jgi:hypothetical protein
MLTLLWAQTFAPMSETASATARMQVVFIFS